MFGSLATISAIAFVVGLAMYITGVGRKWAMWAMLIAGIGAAGIFGRFGKALAGILLAATDKLTAAVLGTGVAVALAIVLGLYLWSKRKGGGKLAMAAAFIFPSMLAAVGLAGLVSTAGDAISTTGQTTTQIISQLGG